MSLPESDNPNIKSAADAVRWDKMFAAIGQPMWSNELLGKLMAWAVATGFRECTTQAPMFQVLMVARERFGIEGGVSPNLPLLRRFYEPRLSELRIHREKTPWLPELMERYKVEGWETYDYHWADDIKIGHYGGGTHGTSE